MAFLKSTYDHDDDEEISSNITQLKTAGNGGGGAGKTTSASCSWRIPFQIFTTILLSLLLPLSFLLLARLSAAHYLSLIAGNESNSDHPAAPAGMIASFLFLYKSKSIFLYALVSLITAAAFVHGLTSTRLILLTNQLPAPAPEPVSRRHPNTAIKVYLAWVLLFTFQVCVGLGIEGSICAGIDGSGFAAGADEKINDFLIIITTVIRAFLLVGLHETMSFWSRYVVKPVVADTVGGGDGDGSKINWDMIERIGVALSLGALWWWRLRDEVEALVAVPELIAREGRHVVGAAEFSGWWLYYLTVSIGTMRLFKGAVWVVVAAVVTSSARNDVDFDETTSDSDSVDSQFRHHQPLEEMV
ncbi:OLC1v1004397C1 [Oldenlandia corymbosa var. corymbosa]|uniref:OLC1v1004397C1 n=1 Tax=Oldenlandia corymbosa var. corymbosa TaxID=529605 RepID=A0AAV1DC74_OLDCO|nr:OLC1v1004397C1 [Oldenlandia corymbosa var. corymbosa]